MPTHTLPRTFSRAGATVVLTALAAAGASWVAAPPALAAGENGDIRIHREGVPFGVSKDDPTVCKFYLDAANFDVLPSIAYTISPQPPLPTAATVAGTIQLAGGAGHTDPLGLADGQYKITWVVAGAAKEKVFHVDCRDQKPGAQGPGQIEDHQNDGAWSESGKGDGPKGGVHAGGGGLIDPSGAFSPVAAAAAVGLVAVSGAVYLRLVRRRPNGAA
ncbi:hypothetical protein KUM39_17755 [Streptomyces sp. J2-1]|uniref:hypothetical protein n=1 Tax=Streptomyces corallincola TaxID=2851888 RepID=UPI001C395702|nr:hypothetical protein [Streptomyces corallincola]MBV2356197.1 hypothetical protein [Streptomyces corallincola]